MQEIGDKHRQAKIPLMLAHMSGYRGERWVVTKCEAHAQGTNRRAVVTNRPGAFVPPGAAYGCKAIASLFALVLRCQKALVVHFGHYGSGVCSRQFTGGKSTRNSGGARKVVTTTISVTALNM